MKKQQKANQAISCLRWFWWFKWEETWTDSFIDDLLSCRYINTYTNNIFFLHSLLLFSAFFSSSKSFPDFPHFFISLFVINELFYIFTKMKNKKYIYWKRKKEWERVIPTGRWTQSLVIKRHRKLKAPWNSYYYYTPPSLSLSKTLSLS